MVMKITTIVGCWLLTGRSLQLQRSSSDIAIVTNKSWNHQPLASEAHLFQLFDFVRETSFGFFELLAFVSHASFRQVGVEPLLASVQRSFHSTCVSIELAQQSSTRPSRVSFRYETLQFAFVLFVRCFLLALLLLMVRHRLAELAHSLSGLAHISVELVQHSKANRFAPESLFAQLVQLTGVSNWEAFAFGLLLTNVFCHLFHIAVESLQQPNAFASAVVVSSLV